MKNRVKYIFVLLSSLLLFMVFPNHANLQIRSEINDMQSVFNEMNSSTVVTEGDSVFGYVTSSNGQVPWDSTNVTVYDTLWNPLDSALTDATGFYDIDSLVTSVSGGNNGFIPVSFKLHQNWPNSYGNLTNIVIQNDKTQSITLGVYDVLGQEVETLFNDEMAAGFKLFKLDASNYASGIYFIRATDGKNVHTIKTVHVGGGKIPTSDRYDSIIKKAEEEAGKHHQQQMGKPTLTGNYYMIFTDLKGRAHPDTAYVTLPAQVDQILQGIFGGYQGNLPIQGEEGKEVGVRNSDFPYYTGLDSLIIVDANKWRSRSTGDSTYFSTKDTTLSGLHDLLVIARSNGGTETGVNLPVNLEDYIHWVRRFVNDLKFERLNGIIHPGAGLKGKIDVDGQIFNSDAQGVTSSYDFLQVESMKSNHKESTPQATPHHSDRPLISKV